ncbi:MAG: ATP-binding protein [Aquisalimonadaceae bacterium]
MSSDFDELITRAERVLRQIEQFLPGQTEEPDWDSTIAFRWRRRMQQGRMVAVRHPHDLSLQALKNVDHQKALLDRNTRQFVEGLPANNALLWGSRGTGKSSLVKAMLNAYASRGLRLIEVDRTDLVDLPDIIDLIWDRPERFILFCDDLSFEADDPSYKALKATLDGSLSASPDNLLIYATSNRRHLLPEYMTDNEEARVVDGEIHHGEAVEEKISLSERFGLWVSFYPFNQDAYLNIVHHWLAHFGVSEDEPEALREEALRYALTRGSRSGRVAWQFARDWAGRKGLAQ